MAVNKISNEKIQRLRNKSIEKLPDIVRGISPTELKKKFTGFVLDPTDSIIDEINRIVEEVNQKQEDSIPIKAVGGVPFEEDQQQEVILHTPFLLKNQNRGFTSMSITTNVDNNDEEEIIDLTQNWDTNKGIIDLTKKWKGSNYVSFS